MAANRSSWVLAALVLAACGLTYAQGNVPPSRTRRGTGALVQDLSAFPPGDYQLEQTYQSTQERQTNDRRTPASTMENAFTFDMKYAPPPAGQVALRLTRVRIRIQAAQTMAYDSAGRPGDQAPIFASQFKHVLGLTSRASLPSGGPPIKGFSGLDAGWDRYAAQNPDLAAVAKMNKRNYGDGRIDRMMARGYEFLPRPGDAAALRVGHSWQVTATRPGLRGRPTDTAHTCSIAEIQDGTTRITVAWKINAMKPMVERGKMTTFGVDEQGRLEISLHLASGLITQRKSTVKRIDQMAAGDAPGRITQHTTRLNEVKTFTIRPRAAAPKPAARQPEDVAKAVLAAYKARDILALFKHARKRAQAKAKEIEAELIRQGDKHPAMRGLFKGWRLEAVQTWDGTLGGVRYPSPNKAWVAFNKDARGDLIVVVLIREEGRWCFEDINNCSREDFDKAAKTP